MLDVLVRLEKAIWSWPLLLLILGSGLYLTIRLRALQIRRLPQALRLIFAKEEGKTGGISAFSALCTSLSATIGTGNIVGVATALAIGGPGALVWMELSALTGMAVMYAEGFLAAKYRRVLPDGTYAGGPYEYIEQGLGKRWKPMAKLCALFGAAAGVFGVGTFVQVNSMSTGLQYFLEQHAPSTLPQLVVFGQNFDLITVVFGAVVTLLAGIIILGGIRRIAAAASVLVPVMAGLYMLCSLWIIAANATALPQLCGEIFTQAFSPAAATGGAAGGLFAVIQAGISRGVFSNEAGIGTAAIAAAATGTKNPVRQGLVSMTATFFDTIVICTATGLVLLLTGAPQTGIESTGMSMYAFANGLPLPSVVSHAIILLCLCLFSFATVIGWNYFGVQCLRYLADDNRRITRIYQTLYVASVFFAPHFPVAAVWTAANISNGLMCVPNLIAVLLLSGTLCAQTRDQIDKPA